ncbi:MAG: IS5 family transposase [Chloroflexota bacterium]|nr:IS5 family transposase [Chloroflexota bacterium]
MLATDANGLPLGILTMSAGIGEVRMAQDTLATISVPQKKGKPKSRPRQLIADKGYDSRAFRRSLHKRGIRPCIPPKRRPKNWKPRQGRPVKTYTEEYRHRWPVERTFAWLRHQRRPLVRHEHTAANFHAFYTIACIRIAVNRLIGASLGGRCSEPEPDRHGARHTA